MNVQELCGAVSLREVSMRYCKATWEAWKKGKGLALSDVADPMLGGGRRRAAHGGIHMETKNMVKVITLRMDRPAQVEEIEVNADGTIGYKTIQVIVEGVFQALYLGRGITLWINDNGRINGMEPNFQIGSPGRWKGEPICGPALLTQSNSEGDTLGLSQAAINLMMPLVELWKRFTPEERQAMVPLPSNFKVTVLTDRDLAGEPGEEIEDL